MEGVRFYLMIKGPKAYLPEGTKYEEHIITQEDIDESRENDESDEEVIDYFIEDTIAEWAQHWCTACTITKEEYLRLTQ
jgi:hypothetical protein